MPSAISQIIKFINEKPVLRSWEDWINFLFLHLGAPVGDQLQGLVCDSHSQAGKGAVDEALGPCAPVQKQQGAQLRPQQTELAKVGQLPQPMVILRIDMQAHMFQGRAELRQKPPADLLRLCPGQQRVAPDEGQRQDQQQDKDDVPAFANDCAHQSLYSNIRSYILTVSPSLTPISSMRRKTPASRRTRSKYIRLS